MPATRGKFYSNKARSANYILEACNLEHMSLAFCVFLAGSTLAVMAFGLEKLRRGSRKTKENRAKIKLRGARPQQTTASSSEG